MSITWNERLVRAKNLAQEGHESISHKRKYSGQPYFIHCLEVAEIVSSVTTDEDMIIAAFFHDWEEDVAPIKPEYSLNLIEKSFGSRVASLVAELTDEFIKEKYPEMNRKARKAAERKRLGEISREGKTIKLADLISNTRDIVKNDPDFARVYLDEKEALLPYLVDGHPDLLNQATHQLLDSKRVLGLTMHVVSAKV